ncbi:MAG: hypothetical protein ACYTFG_01905 [Planctomycetota bacterium]|jgi:hypothetical protein
MKAKMFSILLALAFAAAATAGEKALYEKIDEAIKKGVEYLKSCQKDDGSFGKIGSERLYGGGTGEGYPHRAGLTALALYALLKSGVKPNDPVILRGFAFIEENSKPKEHPTDPPKSWVKVLSSYELSAMILALEARHNPHKKESIRVTLEKAKALKRRKRLKRPKPIVLPKLERDMMQDWVDRLIKRRAPHGWRYNILGMTLGGLEFQQDMSSTQLAMLALRAASHCYGIKFDRKILYEVIDFCLAQQDPDGPKYEIAVDRHAGPSAPGKSIQVIAGKVRGFAYNRKSNTRHEKISTGSMTTAGCANLIICRELLDRDPIFRRKYEVKVKQAIQDSFMWVEKHWSMEKNPRSGSYFYYYLYGIERVGDLKGTLVIGDHYWYNEGAELLVEDQENNGAWQRGDTHFPQDVINTCFALLFLDRATPPIVVSGGH